MTGNGIESDFVLPDSLFISDYSTLPAFYPHFGANCRFFCTISMSPDSSALFPSRTLPEALPLDSAKGSSTLWTPIRAIELRTSAYCARVFIGGTPNAKEPPLLAGTALLIVSIHSSRNICCNCECPLISACLHFRPDGIVAALIFRLHSRLDFSRPRKSFHAKNFSITRTEYTPSPGIPSPFAAAFLR